MEKLVQMDSAELLLPRRLFWVQKLPTMRKLKTVISTFGGSTLDNAKARSQALKSHSNSQATECSGTNVKLKLTTRGQNEKNISN